MTEIGALGKLSDTQGISPQWSAFIDHQTDVGQTEQSMRSNGPLQVVLERPAGTPELPERGLVDNLTAAADRWRAEFDSAQSRLATPSGGSALELAMSRSLQVQADIFRVSAGIHIGLSANQQTQGAVRTLVEKS